MTVGIVRPTVVPVEDLLVRTLVFGARRVCACSASTCSSSPCSPARSATPGPAPARDRGRCSHGAALRAAAAPALRLVRRLDPRQPRRPLRRRWPGSPPPSSPTDDGADQLAAVARAVADAFGVGFVRVEVDRPGGERLTATHGDRPAEVRTLPITYRDAGGRPPGAAGARAAQPAVPPRRAAARRPGPAGGHRGADQPAGRRAPGEPRAAGRRPRGGAPPDPPRPARRPRPVAERRRLPARVRAAARRPGPGRAPSRIARVLSGHVQEVVADVRRLVHDLRPPALDDRGLVGALPSRPSDPAAAGSTVRGRRPRHRCPPRSRWRPTGSSARR